MEVSSFLPSQSIRFIETEPVLEKRSPVPLIKGVQEKYGFVEVPKTLAELDFKTGVSFLRGYYKGKIIDKLQIYENGLLCGAQESTNLTDEFISELLTWAREEQDLPIKQTGVKAYVSQLEVMSTVDLASMFSKLDSMGIIFSDMLSAYGQPVLEYKISGLRMHYDSFSTPIPRAPEFVFERRAGSIYSTNLFFTSAPVRTDDHLRLLNTMEELLS